MKVKPLRDKVVVKRLEEEEVRKSGIIIPDTAKEKPQQGKVIAVGSGKLDRDGNIRPMTVKEGDRVLLEKWAGTDIKIDEDEYLILNEDDILAIID